jgi:enediyne biosynthesis protein E4
MSVIAKKPRRLSRGQKVWLSIGGTVVGLLGLTGIAIWIGAARDTDLADPTAGVTSVFKNEGSADAPPIRFTDVAKTVGVVMRHGPGKRGRTLPEDTGSGIAWGDYDSDGDPDLYVVNFAGPLGGEPDPAGSNRLFRNDGGKFVDVTEAAGVGDLSGFGMGASFADYDGDGDVDLYVTNMGPNRLYRNRGDGVFDEVAAQAGVADGLWSTGATWGDYDRDGDLDLYVCNYVRYDAELSGEVLEMESTGGALSIPFTLNPNSFDPVPNRLYRNRGDGSFDDVAEQCGVSDPEGRSLGATLCDLDGDGWLDLYINNDVSTNRLYHNLGRPLGGGESSAIEYADLSAITGTADPRGSMGMSVGEIGAMSDAYDGLPDLFITHWLAQENAFYLSVQLPGGGFEYRDKTRQFRVGEISIDTVGWGSALCDLDRDGRLDIAVANGSTLEKKGDYTHLMPEPLFLFWNDGKRFVNIAPDAGDVCARRHCARGLAAADFDGDGDVDLAVAINRGQPLLLRNDTVTSNRSLTVRLRAPAAACFGARVELVVGGEQQVRWCGADVTFMGMHGSELLFGLGENERAEELSVRWADGRSSRVEDVAAGRLEVDHAKSIEPRKPR